MNAAVTKRTQETLGKVIKKPPLTEKLLSKPPFRYLHDILSEVIRTTGFMKGLYGEAEMKSDNVKDKDSKIAFLQKAIDVVMLVSGESVAAKPARIVAGHEPEKTNELLQTIAKCCINKLSSDEAVRRVVSGDKFDLKGKASSSRSQGKENREEKREINESSNSTEQKDPDQLKEVDSRRIEKERPRDRERTGNVTQEKARTKDRDLDKDKSHDRDKDRTRDKERGREKEKDRDKDKVQGRDRDREKNRDRDRDRHKERERTNEREQDRERDKTKERDLQKDRERVRDKDKDREQGKRMERETEQERLKKQEHQRKPQEQLKENTDKKNRSAEETSKQRPLLDEPSQNHRTEPAEQESPNRIPRPSSAKGQRRRPKPGTIDKSDSDMVGDTPSSDGHIHLENGHAPDITASFASQSNRRIVRPSSARPAPPRVKRQESYTDAGTMNRLGSAKHSTAVIVDGKKLSEDEDEDIQFVVEEAAPPVDMPELQAEPLGEDDETHGGLVKKILETKKDYESSASAFSTQKQDRTPVLEAARKKERELVAKEIERMRTSIQSVCRSALPLGKIMDYIQEDMDAMQNELQSWRCENKVHAQALLEEQRITDEAVQPLKAQLSELEQLIRNEQEKICAIKSNILGNEEKIQKMLSSITISSRS